MRLSAKTWVIIAILLMVLGVYCWNLGNRVQKDKQREAEAVSSAMTGKGNVKIPRLNGAGQPLLTQLNQTTRHANQASPEVSARYQEPLPEDPLHPHRLRNTAVGVDQLVRLNHVMLLNNALIDTSSRRALEIPSHLQAPIRTRSYLIQTDKPFDEVLPAHLLEQLAANKVSYIPNNAWLVRADPDVMTHLKNISGVRAVVPYAPYFKISESLLPLAVERTELESGTLLSLTVFPDESLAAESALHQLGLQLINRTDSPFGDQYVVHATPDSLIPLANLDLVQWVEPWHQRELANDLSRGRVTVDTDGSNLTNENHHGLSGSGVLININDSGVDATHPDLIGRVESSGHSQNNTNPGLVPTSSAGLVSAIRYSGHLDSVGHGTHVAGILASSGENSPTITNIINSATNANFHGMAPEAELLSLTIDLLSGPLESDEELQALAAEHNYITEGRTNAMISNNSWNYPNSQEYGLASASFDAAVRDALPYVEGEQPMVYVFSSGNAGNGNQSGRGGSPGSILAPATAKNVITVGAIETLRFITNEVVTGFVDQITTNDMGVVETNQIPVLEKAFLADTDSATEVASFSSRGNVGIGVEGEGGRFKPDVVAPGTYVVSTRSKDWESPEGLQNTILNLREGISVNPGELYPITVFVPLDSVEVRVRIRTNEDAPLDLPDLPVYGALGRFPTTEDFVGLNTVTLALDSQAPLNLVPGNIYFFSIGNNSEQTMVFDLETAVVTEEDQEGFYEGLAELNEGLEPHYRFESGSSMAAPVVSGTLALMQEYLTEKGHNPSPALLKALLINGSRSSGTIYDYQIDPLVNYQGWGLPNLNNSMPQSFFETDDNHTSSVQFFDQDTERSLGTGDSVSWDLNISTNGARAFPLRVSLVWTDPPGNPAAGVKLVNDLDLVVSNTLSGEVFYGNDFAEASLFTRMSASDSVAASDVVNNVENVYINGPLSTNYVVSVIGRRVNVNAVFDHPDGVVQDFALVISSGDDSELEAPFELESLETPLPPVFPPLIAVTNGIPRLEDRVGANAPLLGTTNGLAQQWQFYTFTNALPSTNDVGFTNGPNVAFVTFLPPELGKPRVSEADIDLYVSRDAGLLDLDEGVVSAAAKSLNQGGTEVVLFENQPLGDDVVYYVGVKSEDHQGAQYAMVGLSQEEPFDFTDQNGNRVFRGIPLNQGIIPDGTPGSPGAGLGIAIGNPLNGLTVQSVVVEQTVFHEDIGDLLGSISHNGVSAVLNNHTLLSPQGSSIFLDGLYDDFGVFPNSIPSDGPGNLINFIGENGVGVWLMTMVDNALSQTGRLSGFRVVATPNQLLDENGLFATVQAESFRYFFVEVPPDASAFTVNLTEFNLPLDLYLRLEELPTQTIFDKRALGVEGENIVTVTMTPRDIPPLNAGRYFIGVYNPHPVAVDFRLTFDIERNLIIDSEQPFFPDEVELPILDFAQTDSDIFVADSRRVAEAKIGLRIDHPRLSDLSMHLVSPQGTRVLLAENRGGDINTGLGSGTSDEPVFAGFSDDEEDADTLIKFARGPFTTNAVTSITPISGFEQAPNGIIAAVESFPADDAGNMWDVISGRVRIVDRNAPEGRKFAYVFSSRMAITIPTPPGRKFDLFYSTRSSAGRGSPVGLAFLDGRQAQVVDGSLRWRRNTPIRFVPARPETLLEFTFVKGRPAMSLDDIEIRDAAVVKYYFPEEPLEVFKGESAVGNWSLEINDTRDGAIEPPPILQNWQLLLSLANTNVQAETLRNGQCFTGKLDADEVHYFIVETPRIATMATNWLTGTGDLEMWFDNTGVPTGDSPPDVIPSIDFNGTDEGEGMLLSLGGMTFFDSETNQLGTLPEPALQPGQRYYLAVANRKSSFKQDYELCLQFDADDVQIIALTNTIPFSNTIPFTDDLQMQYYRYRAASNVVELDIELEPANGDVNMVEKYGLPLPNLAVFDQRSELPGLLVDQLFETNKPPATIFPGSYYIGVYNAEANRTDVDYQITVTETTVPYNVIRLTDGESIDFKVGDNFASDDAKVENYFLFEVASTNAVAARFEIFGADGDAQFALKKEELPTFESNDRLGSVFGDRPGSGKLIVRTNDTLPSLDGNWFLSVLNQQTEDLNFTIRASLETNQPPVITLESNIWRTNTVAIKQPDFPQEINYYRFVVDPAAEEVTFTLDPIAGGAEANVDLILRKDQLPSLTDLDDFSFSDNSITETIVLNASTAVALSGGEWFLGVINREAEDQVTYRVRASQSVDVPATALQDEIWVTNVISGNQPGSPAIPEIYYFDVDEDTIDVTFTLSNLEGGQNGNLDLLLKFGNPPVLSAFDTASVNPGNVDEVIQLNQDSSPVLVPGRWYLSVINRETTAVDYRIMANAKLGESPKIIVVPVDIIFLGDEICVSWESEIGQSYWVEGKVLEEDPVWDGLAGPIIAGDVYSEYCFDLPIEYQLFRVVIRLDNQTPSDYIDPVVDVQGDQLCLNWNAETGSRYRIQGRTSLLEVAWNNVDEVVADRSDMQYCLALDTPYRFFRIEPIEGEDPPAPPVIDPVLALVGDQLCMDWATEVNRSYVVQAKVNLEEEAWTDLSSLTAIGEITQYCVDLPAPYRFFRIVVGDLVSPPREEVFVDVVLSVGDNEICLDWDSETGRTYQIEGLVDLRDGDWAVIDTFIADANQSAYCLALPTEIRFLRVLAGDIEAPVDTVEFIDAILQIEDKQICLEWPSHAGDIFTVEARSDLQDSVWTAIEQVQATGDQARYCVQLPTKFRFFRIRSGGGDPQPPGDRVISAFIDPVIEFDQNRICLLWTATEGSDYVIQGNSGLTGLDWQKVEVITANDANMQFCVSLPTTYQFFRIGELAGQPGVPVEPVVLSYIDPIMALADDQVCLSWSSTTGEAYQVEATSDISVGNWAVLETLESNGNSLTHCIDLPAEHAFYRIAVLEGNPREEGKEPGVAAPANIDSVSFANGQITVRWSGMSGLAYRISFANSLLGPWSDIPQVIISETDSFEFVDDGSLTGGLLSPRFYRVNLLPMP